jgi:hypothetical protein
LLNVCSAARLTAATNPGFSSSPGRTCTLRTLVR